MLRAKMELEQEEPVTYAEQNAEGAVPDRHASARDPRQPSLVA